MHSVRIQKLKLARKLREDGYSYLEIASHEAIQAPRSTVVSWCAGTQMNPAGMLRHRKEREKHLEGARKKSAQSHIRERELRLSLAQERAAHSGPFLTTENMKKSVLGALYLAEGTKRSRGCLTLGNSDPEIVKLYLRLLRECFAIDESKFRCTLQARAGQDIPVLEKFWASVTGISASQFYPARIDMRGDGKLARKPGYKGVCRIDYFSSDLLYEVLAIGRILTKGP